MHQSPKRKRGVLDQYLNPTRKRGVLGRSSALAALMAQPLVRRAITTGKSMVVLTPR